VPEALANGLQKGISNATGDLLNPDNYQTSTQAILDQPFLQLLSESGYKAGLIEDGPQPTPTGLLQAFTSLLGISAPDNSDVSPVTGIVQDLTAAITAAQAPTSAIQNTITALLTTLPDYDANIAIEALGLTPFGGHRVRRLVPSE
jgi:hypothetical protein